MNMDTLVASLRSIGQASTLASCGFYISRYSFLTPSGKKQLAKISQQVTIPLLLFSKIIYCNQDWSDEPCPDVRDSISQGYFLLFYPIFVVLGGLLVGSLGATIVHCPPSFKPVFVACVTFGNSTGLPITLLTVIHASFSKTTELGAVDPTLFLGVYLLVYPVLQWGIGGFLLAPQTPVDAISEPLLAPTSETTRESSNSLVTVTLNNHVLRPSEGPKSEESVMKLILKKAITPPVVGALSGMMIGLLPAFRSLFVDLDDRDNDAPLEWWFNGLYTMGQAAVPVNMIILGASLEMTSKNTQRGNDVERDDVKSGNGSNDGCKDDSDRIPLRVFLAIVVCKMIIMPLFGVGAVYLLRTFLNVSDDVDASFYLVVMIVVCSPTANNVMVMAELAGVNRNGVAKAILVQYSVAPIILTGTVGVAVTIAKTL